ncbi:MAG: EVE domain-containing protein [Calditrichia bacterium]
MNYWLLKSDPDEFGWEDLKKAPGKSTTWDGVRNYQARNNLQKMKKGDLALFYHSAVNPQTIPGIVEVVKEAIPDPTQFEKDHEGFDPKSNPENPRWFMVEVKINAEFKTPLTRDEMKSIPELAEMALFRNSRLSVQPVTIQQWNRITALGKQHPV